MTKLLEASRQDVAYSVLGEVRLLDGTPVQISLVQSCGKEEIGEGFRRLSKTSRCLRFHSSVGRLTDAQLAYLTDIDTVNRVVVAAHVEEGVFQKGVGLARYSRLAGDPRTAEFAVTVVDACQGQGVGKSLLANLRRVACSQGITTLRGYVLKRNACMIHILDGLGATGRTEIDGTRRYDLSADVTPAGSGR
jgi:GNAT superfamily N-acetyltransferase